MPQVTLTTGQGGPQAILRNYWKVQLQKMLDNDLLAADLLEAQVIPANSGTVIEFHRINSFPKMVTGISQFLGYMTVGDLRGQSFTIDSVVYSLALLGNDLQISE